MKTKNLFGILMLFLFTFTFISCDKEDEEGRKITDYKEYVLTVASEMKPGVMSSDGYNYLNDVYPVKKENTEDWEAMGYIDGFEFEKGYEYKIKISETSYLDYRMGQPAWTEYDLLDVLSKEKKNSEGLPLHFIPEWFYEEHVLPKYQYAVETDNKEVIEEDLRTNSILPLDYHYMLYRGEDSSLRWIAIKDDSNTLGPCIIKSENKDPEKMPESYKLLPWEGNVYGFMGWQFLDEEGNETNYPSFDVFASRSTKSRTFNPAPNTVCLYKDLTEYYKNKYPEAGVKAVVVSYAIEIN
ncbi:DUF4377 domain-containing protein [Phocaeicola plebeius]|uniref:DUF4377 domain-containing protein n=1 Tax=Phocaeicola plebeius TaxID=310297 RepID=UPI0026F28970|nr:DUF4377 domain-containing protein [Phocaeicola plebeius]MCI6050221.1 DUF4377 domain-containing protein [Phocaeicola plebeius]MDD6914190.1 DUF4377 domain-containing protein [Phocaeicola plebeius]MDY5977633.1 DUF4377 domain-containing protein [Phocaeicola plebeius]